MMLRRYNTKYSKAADRSKIAEEAKENDYSALSTEELQEITNPKLKAYLDEKGIEYPSKANKDELIELVAGK